MKRSIIGVFLLIIISESTNAQYLGHLEIGLFGQFWPMQNHLVKDPFSPSFGGFEIGTGISLFDKHILELGFTTGFSLFNERQYNDPVTFNTPEVTKTKMSIFYIKGQVLFFPVNLAFSSDKPKRINPYVILEYGPEVSYYKKTITLDYPKYQVDTNHLLRSPSMNFGMGIGSHVLVSRKNARPLVAINIHALYMFSGLTRYATVDTNLGYFDLNEGRKEYIVIVAGITLINFLH